MNEIVIIDSVTLKRTKEEYSDAYEFARKIDEMSRTATLLFYGRNAIGGASAIYEV